MRYASLAMCGIAGVIGYGVGTLETSLDSMTRSMIEAQRHRGPDDGGVWSSPSAPVSLGHRRLSIIDLSAGGAQPMTSRAGSVLVFNGEIYNYRALKARYEQRGAQFRTDSDTEVLLEALERDGEDALEHLIGMFAFAWWCPTRQRLLLARDRLGQKPLYLHYTVGQVQFASEIRSFFSAGKRRPALDPNALLQTMVYGFTPQERTAFEDVMRLPPGAFAWLDPARPPRAHSELDIQTYWTMPVGDDTIPDAPERLHQLVEDAVDLRMVSDVPVGVFLSGGVDSTGIASLMRRQSQSELHSFSTRFREEGDYDESEIARGTATRLGLTHHESEVASTDLVSMVGDLASIFDDPLIDPTCIPIYFLSELASEAGTKVVLTGDGPDEIFLGYRSWTKYLRGYPWFRRWSAAPKLMRLGLWKALLTAGASDRTVELGRRAHAGEELFWGRAPSFRARERNALLHPRFRSAKESATIYEPIRDLREEFDSRCPASMPHRRRDAAWLSYAGVRLNIPHMYLHRMDRIGMWHSIEVRTPYLDHRLVEWGMRLTPNQKREGDVPKAPLKKALAQYVPRTITSAPKRGFCVPYREWAGGEMVDTIEAAIPKLCQELEVFDAQGLRRTLSELRSGDAQRSENLWTLFFLASWLARWA